MKNNKALALQESTEKERIHGQNSQISEPSVFWFPVYEGLFEHAPIIRDAVWFFMWLIGRTTCEADGRGTVLGGIPIHDDRPAQELCFPVKTIRRWRRMLIRGGYIVTVRTPYGFRYTLLKSKKWQSPPKRDLPKLPISHQESAQIGHRELPLRAQRVPISGVSKKTTQRQHREEAAAPPNLEPWKAIGLYRSAGDAEFIEFWETSWANRNGRPVPQVMGEAADAWEASGGKVPGQFFARLAEIRKQEASSPVAISRMPTLADICPKER